MERNLADFLASFTAAVDLAQQQRRHLMGDPQTGSPDADIAVMAGPRPGFVWSPLGGVSRG